MIAKEGTARAIFQSGVRGVSARTCRRMPLSTAARVSTAVQPTNRIGWWLSLSSARTILDHMLPDRLPPVSSSGFSLGLLDGVLCPAAGVSTLMLAPAAKTPRRPD